MSHEPISQPPQPTREALQTLPAWVEAQAANTAVYALIDMAAMPSDLPVPRALQEIRAAGAVSVLADARPQAELATPWLLPLTGQGHQSLNRPLLTKTLDWALRGPCVTWVSSSLSAAQLAERLRQRTEAMLPQNQPVLLRCYDPRVLPELHKALYPEQASRYWALGNAWAYFDRAQQLGLITLSPPSDIDVFEGPLSLDQGQFEALLDASEVDSVMPELAREATDAFLTLPPDQRASFTQRCLKLADEWRVQAFGQRVMVGVLALQLGEGFHQQKSWAPWIAQLAQGKIDLIQTIEGATTE
ncbi:DUF4123 domain-containing protein [Aquabacterium sp.]|uniref:DUF4123 domain-containing protein n=1 Tax=Aquabacterium sp. TaxID=1872578 RepID=UPI00248934FB|nr:DUF4123 domain-containing protein [Aquabacterium sp.]MDI1259922.1 DUF4123 domain-containing protein [Aquabacterium sp.]